MFGTETPTTFRPSADLDGDWNAILSAQSAWINGNPQLVLESLQNLSANHSREQHAIALYYEGLALQQLSRDGNDDRHEWALKLLQIPASYQDDFPELAAAAIFAVVSDSRHNSPQWESLHQELLGRFASTWHGRLFRTQQEHNTR